MQRAPDEVRQQALAQLKTLSQEEDGIYKLSHGSGVFVVRRESAQALGT
ncbi:MAG: hypothetical protein AAGF95_25605 [Chloroflexota bacterium]